MNDLGLTVRQVRYTNKAFWRNPAAVGFTFAFPLVFLVIFTAIFGNTTTRILGEKVNTSTFYVASISALSVITACFTNIGISVATQREEGVLKRLRGTPLPAWAYLVGRVIHATLVAVLLVAIVIAFGGIFYHADVPTRTLPALLAGLAVGAGTFTALGLAVTAIIPNVDAAPPITNFIILPLYFISGYFVPPEQIPSWMTAIAKVFPLRHFLTVSSAAFFTPPGHSPWQLGDLMVLGAWGVGGLLVAARFFSWEPRR